MSTLKITIGSITDRGLNPRRTANEDRLLVMPDSGLYVVADGVGGHRGGQVASQTAVDVFAREFANPPFDDVLSLVKQTINAANQSIYQASHELAELEGMASTLAVVAIDGHRAIIAHVGDSRVYRFDGKRLTCETEDHSEINDAVRAGTMTMAQAANHPHRNIINRALGADLEVEADFKILTLEARTSFLLCSDGITRHISDEELERLLNSGQHPNNICLQLKETCFARGAEDNLTAVIVDCGERAYVEDATRPTLSKTAVVSPALAASASSRISVDFNTPTNTTAMPVKPAPQRATTNRSSLASGLLQLGLLIAALAIAFAAGRYWPQILSFVQGAPPAANNAPAGTPPIETNPDLAAAQALFEEKRYDKALKGFVDLVNKDGANAEARYWLGRTHYELKQPAEAIKQLNEASKLDGNLPNIYVHLALAYEAAGDKKNALESLRRAIAPTESPAPTITATPAG